MNKINAILNTLYNPQLRTIDLSLDRIHAFLQRLENPERRIPPVIHVAGTNGKGSVIAYLKAILEQSGLRVHRYTSPHLVKFNERIESAGKPIDDKALLMYLQRVQQEAKHQPVTFFEATTAAAFLAFADTPADITLLETGMGGRLDATNVIEKPIMTIITSISADHQEFLGETLELIAAEKAAIAKPGVPCIIGPQEGSVHAVLDNLIREKGGVPITYGNEWHLGADIESGFYYNAETMIRYRPSLPGLHQYINAATAIAATKHLTEWNIQDDAVIHGIENASWPGRLQRLECGLNSFLPEGSELWLDGGHNAEAGQALSGWARAQEDTLPLVLITGMIKGKDAKSFLSPFARHTKKLIAISIPQEATSMGAGEVLTAATNAGIDEIETAATLDDALVKAGEGGAVRVLICGSLYLAGQVLALTANMTL